MLGLNTRGVYSPRKNKMAAYTDLLDNILEHERLNEDDKITLANQLKKCVDKELDDKVVFLRYYKVTWREDHPRENPPERVETKGKWVKLIPESEYCECGKFCCGNVFPQEWYDDITTECVEKQISYRWSPNKTANESYDVTRFREVGTKGKIFSSEDVINRYDLAGDTPFMTDERDYIVAKRYYIQTHD